MHVTRRHAARLATGLLCLLLPAAARAVDLQGSARVYGGPTETENGDVLEQDLLNQVYNVNLSQSFTPWLSMTLGYRYNRFDNDSDLSDFWRRSSEPNIQLAYNRPSFSALFLYSERQIRSTFEVQDLDITNRLVSLGWTPERGPLYSLRWRKQENVADVATFGRNVDTETLDLDIRYDRARWGAGYHYQSFEVESFDTGITLDQIRHELRGNMQDRSWSDRLEWFVNGLFIESRQKERIPAGRTAGQIVRPRAGLYAVTGFPDTVTLEPAPDLVNGDLTTPALGGITPGSPVIEIGGGNTFRNLGLDLGVARQVTRLEITVDAVSDPTVMWAVYESPDNITWTEVAGVTAQFDAALLRYNLFFPLVENRYIKAVNLTPNSQAVVAVTELRSLLDVTSLTKLDGRSMRFNGGAILRPAERFTTRILASYNDDNDLVGGFTGRDYRDYTYDVLFTVDLPHHLAVSAGYRITDYEERSLPQLFRTEEITQAFLDWNPLPTVAGRFLVSERVEEERGQLLRRTDTLQWRLMTEVYDDLQVTSEVLYNDVDDPFAGFRQKTWRLLETASARISRNLRLDGTLSLSWFDFTARVDLERRFIVRLGARWTPVPYLSMLGSWYLNRDQRTFSPDVRNFNQRYTVNWSPGPKLSATVSYQDFDSEDRSFTSASTVGVSYRLNSRFMLFATGNRSKTEITGLERRLVKSLSAGFYLTF